jgi:hypothetical protein
MDLAPLLHVGRFFVFVLAHYGPMHIGLKHFGFGHKKVATVSFRISLASDF